MSLSRSGAKPSVTHLWPRGSISYPPGHSSSRADLEPAVAIDDDGGAPAACGAARMRRFPPYQRIGTPSVPLAPKLRRVVLGAWASFTRRCDPEGARPTVHPASIDPCHERRLSPGGDVASKLGHARTSRPRLSESFLSASAATACCGVVPTRQQVALQRVRVPLAVVRLPLAKGRRRRASRSLRLVSSVKLVSAWLRRLARINSPSVTESPTFRSCSATS